MKDSIFKVYKSCVLEIANNAYKNVRKRKYKLIMFVSLVGIVVGVHSLLHLGLESVYNFNPIELLINT